MTHARKCCPPAQPIVQRPVHVVRDFYHPQLVQVIQPIEVINRHHCVPVYNHVYTFIERDVGPFAPYTATISNIKKRKK
ncbi:hypothetical protein ACVLD2_003112 [Paenibacillus sp. PvR052]|nr:hypothetical protein [Paenibacillus sp. PvP091]MBP1168432.1 hypothetical protein [Paenibacillus sp. PvR098]MBP2439460.1 hypothetical protein [Paenibacillus sp. PvP052]